MNKSQFDLIAAERLNAEKFKKSGGNIQLFWAGRLAIAGRTILNSKIQDLSQNFIWFEAVMGEYDAELLKGSVTGLKSTRDLK